MMFTNEMSRFFMKSESLLSQLSSFSHQSNGNYQVDNRFFGGSEFFRESLPAPNYEKGVYCQLRQEEIELGSLSMAQYKFYAPIPDCIPTFTPYWTTELQQNIEGTSDNENDHEPESKQKMRLVKMEEMGESLSEPPVQEEEKISGVGENGEFLLESDPKLSKNETKNIPKNYGKAIIIFIEKNRSLLEEILIENGHDYDNLLQRLKEFKKKINTISDLRSLWEQEPESKCLRIISNLFLRKYALHYIYNSRIKTRLCHGKYKKRLQEAIQNPKDFNHIKDY